MIFKKKHILWLAVTIAAARELGQRLRGIRFADVLTSPRQHERWENEGGEIPANAATVRS